MYCLWYYAKLLEVLVRRILLVCWYIEFKMKETEILLLLHPSSGNPRCPVASFLKYLSKLNPMNLYLWQRPKASFKHHACEDDPIWYENAAVGHNSLGEMMTNMSKLARLSRIYTNNCIRGTYVAILDSLVEDYPLITTLVSIPSSQRFQHILPRDPCDERPTMVPVTGKYISSSEGTTSPRTTVGTPPFNVESNREQAQLTKIMVPGNHSHPQHHNGKTRSSPQESNGIDHSEKQRDRSPTSPTEPVLGLPYQSSHRSLHSPFVAYRFSQLHAASQNNLRNPHQPSLKTSLSLSQGSVTRAGSNHSGLANSRVVYCQTVPAMASSSTLSVTGVSGYKRHSSSVSNTNHYWALTSVYGRLQMGNILSHSLTKGGLWVVFWTLKHILLC